MAWYVRRAWLVEALAEALVECIVIDDAQDLNLAHLAFLKELTDNLAAPPYLRQVGLCLVTAHGGNVIPLKEIFSRPDTRLPAISSSPGYDTPRSRVVQGHTEEEVRDILATFEAMYRSQLPQLQLERWAKPIFTWLTHPALDLDRTGRVTMDHLSRLVTSSLRESYGQRATDMDPTILQATAELMILRRDEITEIAGPPSDPLIAVQEVG